MRDLVEYIAKNLVDEPEQVRVEEREEDGTHIIEVAVAEKDMGRVIGKQGRIARAIRMIVKAASIRSSEKYVVVIV